MHTLYLRTSVLVFAIAGLCGPALAGVSAGSTANAGAAPTHPAMALPATLRPALYRALAKDAGPVYRIKADGCASLPKSALRACFDRRGAHFSGADSLALRLTAWGRGGKLATVKAVKPTIKGNQVSYGHGNLSEWWRVLPIGFEQGFTIAKRPAGQGGLTLALTASRQDAGAPTIRHSRRSGNLTKNTIRWGKLRYGKLIVTDANGKVVPATLKSKDNHILIAVNDTHATYPLTVDPLVWIEQKVTASDGNFEDQFGWAVALDGMTALLGARFADINGNSDQGAAYVFKESNGTWSEKQKLTASDGAANDAFGSSITLVGTTALIGAAAATINGTPFQGAVYVFRKSGGSWSQAQKLIASDGAADDQFGDSVALVGSTAVIGAPFAKVNGNSDQGAAYVFGESDGSWSQTQKLTASDGTMFNHFGNAVALESATALVGAYGVNGFQGAAYVFRKLDGIWSETQKLIANDGATEDAFGTSIAIDGTTALIGAPDVAPILADNPGAAYIFTKSGGSWSQTQKLTAGDGAEGDQFGSSVAIDGATALVGAYCAHYNPITFDCGPGATYVFDESGDNWTQTAKLTASDGGTFDWFGGSVALGDTTALVGAYSADVNGAAYFYGESDFGLAVSAPQTVDQGQQYVSQAIVTNNSSASSPAVTATMAVPAAASFVSATATQGSCTEDSGVVTCNFGQIAGNGGTATANVTLKAIGNIGDTIQNTASVAKSSPPLTASASTTIAGGCPDGYSEYDGNLNAGKRAAAPPYQAPAGRENAILTAPAGFRLSLLFQNAHGRKLYRIPGHEIHRRAPAGTFTWIVKAGNQGGAYTLCLLHP